MSAFNVPWFKGFLIGIIGASVVVLVFSEWLLRNK